MGRVEGERRKGNAEGEKSGEGRRRKGKEEAKRDKTRETRATLGRCVRMRLSVSMMGAKREGRAEKWKRVMGTKVTQQERA